MCALRPRHMARSVVACSQTAAVTFVFCPIRKGMAGSETTSLSASCCILSRRRSERLDGHCYSMLRNRPTSRALDSFPSHDSDQKEEEPLAAAGGAQEKQTVRQKG